MITAVTTTRTHRAIWQSRRKSIQDLAITPTFYVNWIRRRTFWTGKHYRAVHYIVVYRGVYIEIQIKTLFEEGWGEIDHSILYPRRKGNAMLTEFSGLLNRLAGMGDGDGIVLPPSPGCAG